MRGSEPKGGKTGFKEPSASSPAFFEQAGGSSAGRAVEWQAVDALLLRRCVHAVSAAGAAIILGRTRDGGAFSITCLLDGASRKFYPTSVDELEDRLEALASAAEGTMGS